MGIWLAFAPFIAFALIDRMLGSTEGLLAGFAVSAALLARDWLSAKILFGAPAVWALAFAVMVVADLILLHAPEVPPRVGTIPTVLALVGGQVHGLVSEAPQRRRRRPA
ncbi:hypothetical protein [Bradyrhizobium sp.]|uniref:hypothetical protein n=1 Tax=Bradyrhizobium sp. TaxID=376 RepID=UPI002733653C|nr:hypothetical protein [Bradyrhizobium sp.]MDP3689972.1 hypothetical protein [Bradyrhizobium sp.]